MSKTRSLVVDWIFNVCEEYTAGYDSACLAVHLLDTYVHKSRHFETVKEKRKNLQLLACGCIELAVKYIDRNYIGCKDLSWLTEGSCKTEDISLTQFEIIRVLEYVFPVFPDHHVLFYLSVALKLDKWWPEQEKLCQYLTTFCVELVNHSDVFKAACIMTTSDPKLMTEVVQLTGVNEEKLKDMTLLCEKLVQRNLSIKYNS